MAESTVLTGWGRTQAARAQLERPGDVAEVLAHLTREAAPRGVIARGLGRSYGDPAQIAGGVVLDLTGLDAIGPVDAATGEVVVGGGASLDQLLVAVIPQGWFVPVTPGTRQVTIGGAIAADIHGKNHHVDGSFSAQVRRIVLATPTGLRTCGPDLDPALFWATAGGMGLTGIVVEATVRLLRIESSKVLVDTDRFSDLDTLMAAMVEGDARYRYSVAWVDCMTRGNRLGRGVLTRGDHAPAGTDELVPPSPARLAVPMAAPSGLLNRASIAAFNEAWFRRAPRHEVAKPERLGAFFHPLDGVANWNLLYGARGFLQYQLAVPDTASHAVRQAMEQLSSAGVPSFLAVLKRFGPGNAAPLSFPQAGWTLALDLPIGPRQLPGLLDALDQLVADVGGRIYLAKDSRLRPELVPQMYPNLSTLRAVKAEVDPEGLLTSDLARRLRLLEEP